eukprot:CAMPEP_0170119122 /NCGR_PEP_ID=MMETSP0020_2-20130122/14183_1 /TAXON_ID=98059 /ORGANISM="Dinobryon sp., Strain UTEXLB2267" /LENGTH=205 /DNA_ID=CAMNT_0010348383 /DNA_START=25 /DNA_END=639 /DNA_ORIENTATION=-
MKVAQIIITLSLFIVGQQSISSYSVKLFPRWALPSASRRLMNEKSFTPPPSGTVVTDAFGNLVDESGVRVWSKEYYQYRKEAEEHAKKRALYFEQSQTAFKENRKEDAKSFSDLGKKEGLLMIEANELAVKEIIGPQNLSSSDKIDLHGLLVAEAVSATSKFVEQSKLGGKKSVEIITGAGKHSDAKKGALIKPAIMELCKEKGW